MKPILAFLQNMWVKHPDRVRRSFEIHGEEFRIRFMRYSLFAGCKTGRMLMKAFGEKIIEQIIFEETTREIAGDSKTIFPADLNHMSACVDKHQPEIVVTFGKIAEEAFRKLPCENRELRCRPVHLTAHHPASRHPTSYATLTIMASKLKEYIG